MSIANAVERRGYVYVTNERGQQLFTVPFGNGKDEGLKGYTSSTVNVRRGDYIYTFDEKGRQISSTPAR